VALADLDEASRQTTDQLASLSQRMAEVDQVVDSRLRRFEQEQKLTLSGLESRLAALEKRAETAAGESALGNLIADAQRAAMGTEIALMNPGGIREDILAGAVTWGELFGVQPFGNDLVRLTLSGEQLIALLNQQWAGQPFARVLKPSGLHYRWRENDPATFADNEVDPASIQVNGTPLNPIATYSVTVNSFLASGGDNFSVLTEGADRTVGPVDLDALIDHIEGLPQPFDAAVEGRISIIP
jgi:5'-nucleotidase